MCRVGSLSQTKILKSHDAPLANKYQTSAIASKKQLYTPGRTFHKPVTKGAADLSRSGFQPDMSDWKSDLRYSRTNAAAPLFAYFSHRRSRESIDAVAGA